MSDEPNDQDSAENDRLRASLEAIARGELPSVPVEPEPTFDVEPANARAAKLDLIALEYATGKRTTQLAEAFGYSYGGMSALLNRPEMVERIAATRNELMDRAVAATARILYRLDKLVDHELNLADPPEDNTYAPNGDPLRFHDKKSIDARRYLIDKVVAQKQQVTTLNKTENSPETQQLMSEVTTVLQKLNAAADRRIPNIHNSPHVFDGAAAVSRAIDVEVSK